MPRKLMSLVPFLFLGCATVTREPIPESAPYRPGIHLSPEDVQAEGTSSALISSSLWVRVENQTTRDFDASVLCRWLDAGTEEEFAREEKQLRLPARTTTRAWFRRHFFTMWRISIRCDIEEIHEIAP